MNLGPAPITSGVSSENPKAPKGKLSPEAADEIINAVKRGVPKNSAAALVGISKQLLRWYEEKGNAALEEDPESEDRYAEFKRRLDQAAATYQVSLLDQLHESVKNPKTVDYRPLKHLLSVRFPKDYTYQPQAPGTAQGDGESPDTVTPEEATLSVAAKLAEYLKANPLPTPEGTSGE